MRFHCLQHVPFEPPGLIGTWINDHHHTLTFTRLYNNEPFPSVDDIDALVILGGPMGVHDDHLDWLAAEKAFIAAAILQHKKIVGICLGAQLVAEQLGARVYANPEKEIGCMPVSFTAESRHTGLFPALPPETIVFHWHGDTFDLPPGAVHLAYTRICRNQAYLVGDFILCLQFHLEVTPEMVADMIAAEGDELVEAPYVQTAAQINAGVKSLDGNKKWLDVLFAGIFSETA